MVIGGATGVLGNYLHVSEGAEVKPLLDKEFEAQGVLRSAEQSGSGYKTVHSHGQALKPMSFVQVRDATISTTVSSVAPVKNARHA